MSFEPPIHYIGGGVTEYLSEQIGGFAFGPGSASTIQVDYAPPVFVDGWHLVLSTGNGTPLAPGRYLVPSNCPYENGGPTLRFNGAHRACSASGEFEVFELQRDGDGQIMRLAADFVQLCGGSNAPLRGAIRFNSERPLPP